MISELPKCTVGGAGVNKTMYPEPVIGPGPFSAVWKDRETVCQPALQSRSWCRGLDVLYLLPCPSSYRSLSSCCCAEVGWELPGSVGSTLDYVLGEINQIVWSYFVKSRIHVPLQPRWMSLSLPKGATHLYLDMNRCSERNQLSFPRIMSRWRTLMDLVSWSDFHSPCCAKLLIAVWTEATLKEDSNYCSSSAHADCAAVPFWFV